jgi:hypothetical protein
VLSTLGRPSTKGPYARNVWDLQSYGGKLFIGHGNSANVGPERNAGPIALLSYDPAAEAFATELTAPDEQIDRFEIFDDGSLWTGTHDPRGSGVMPGAYRLSGGGWVRHGTMPASVLHVYDVQRFEGAIYAAGGDGRVYRSADQGTSWTQVMDPSVWMLLRIHELFVFDGRLYAASYALCGDQTKNRLYRMNPVTRLFELDTRTTRDTMFPGYGGDPCVDAPRMVRPTPAGSSLVYIGATIDNDHQWIPKHLYRSSDPGRAATRIGLPEGQVPYDLLVDGPHTYVLTAERRAPGDYEVRVLASTDLVSWTEIVSLRHTTFARSFERLGGDWYFGLGTDTVELAPASGTILRYG